VILSATAGGIAEALVKTSLGLLVAVPAAWAFKTSPADWKRLTWKMNNSLDAISTYLPDRVAVAVQAT